jgi:hypothetical protein
MATLNLNSSFQSWNLTESERIAGSILSILQIQCIQNQIVSLAEEQITLPFLPENIQRNAELLGAIGALKYLLILSENAIADSRSTPSDTL